MQFCDGPLCPPDHHKPRNRRSPWQGLAELLDQAPLLVELGIHPQEDATGLGLGTLACPCQCGRSRAQPDIVEQRRLLPGNAPRNKGCVRSHKRHRSWDSDQVAYRRV